MCCSQTSGSYSPFGSVLGRNHTATWAGCTVSLTTPTGPLPTNLLLMVLVSWGGGEVYSSTSTSSSAGHGYFGGGSSIPSIPRAGHPSSPVPWVTPVATM